jgi:levansucrase
VKLNIHGDSTDIDRTYGKGGLGGYGDISATRAAPGQGGANNGQ